MRKKAIALIIIFSLCLFNGCTINNNILHTTVSPAQADLTSEDETNKPAPTSGGQINIPLVNPDVLNPLLTQSKDVINFSGLIFEGLVEYDSDMTIKPCLADSWSVSEDGTTWTFKLRQDVKWHNGRPFTSEDVKFTFDALRSGKLNSFYQSLIADNPYIQDLTTGDLHTVYLKLTGPLSSALDIMTFPVLPKEVYKNALIPKEKTVFVKKKVKGRKRPVYVKETVPENQNINIMPVGTGPYKIDTSVYDINKEVKLTKNTTWWGKSPNIDTIWVKVYEGDDKALEAFQNGKIDVYNTDSIFTENYLQERNISTYRYHTQSYDFLAFNFKNPIFKDVKVRQAITYAIDRKEIISKVFLNNAEAVDVPIPSDSWLYDPTLRIYDYDPDKAKKLLKEAGWADSDGDGILDKQIGGSKIPLKFTIITNADNDLRRNSALLIKDQLNNQENKLGIKVDVKFVSWEDLNNDFIKTGDFDMLLTGYYLSLFPDLAFTFHTDGESNFYGFSNSELDSLFVKAKAAKSNQILKDIYKEIQKKLISELPVISLYFRTAKLMTNNKISGIEESRELGIYRNIQDWYVIRETTE